MNDDKVKKPTKWSPEDATFKVIKQGAVGYDQMTQEFRGRGTPGQPTTVLYDSVALRYNQCEPGDLFILSLPNKPSISNLRKNLKARGMGDGDYRLFRPSHDESGRPYHINQRPLVLQRLTKKLMTTIQPFPAHAAKLAKLAEQRGTSPEFQTSEIPVNPWPAEEISAGIENVIHT
jgi:hypothetical protein